MHCGRWSGLISRYRSICAGAGSVNPAGIDMRIEAVVTEGGGWASGRTNPNGGPRTIELQKPLMRSYFPEIINCHNGTIKLQLDRPLQVKLPDILTPPPRLKPAA